MQGPAGYDFLTILGAHEGEGMLLGSGHHYGVAGSHSPFISSKGQKVDLKIVEVALFFMKEVVSGGGAAEQGGTELPVMLLSNDNAQIAAARAHGLPAFRMSSGPDRLATDLQVLPHS